MYGVVKSMLVFERKEMALYISRFFDHFEVFLSVIRLSTRNLYSDYSTFMSNTKVLKWNECKSMGVRDAN